MVQRWTTRDDLPQNSINAILQDKDGALWLSTFGGLARFDGRHFTLYDPALTTGLTSNRLLSLLEDKERRIWVSSQEGPTYWIQHNQAHACQGCPPGSTHLLAHDPSTEDILMGRADGLWRWRQGHASRLGDLAYVRALQPWRGATLVGARGGLWRLRGDALEPMALGASLTPEQEVSALHIDQDGLLWVGTTSGELYRQRGQALDLVWHSPDGALIQDMISTPRGELWIATEEGLLVYRHQSQTLTRLVPEDTEGPAGTRSLLYDREGSLWVGTNGAGLWQLRPRELRQYTRRHGLPGMSTQVIQADRQGNLWIGNGGGCDGLARRTPQGQLLPAPQDAPRVCVHALAQARGGGLWVGSREGLYHLPTEPPFQWTAQALPLEPWGSDVIALLETPQGDLWVGTRQDGLWRRDPVGSWSQVRDPQEPLGDQVAALVQAPDGSIWVGTDAGVGRIDARGQLETWGDQQGVPPVLIRDIYVDNGGVAWLASYGAGLLRLEGDRVTHYTTHQGLLDNALSRILADDQGQLWFNSNRGVFRVQRAVLERFAQGRAPEIQSVGYESGEGNGGSQPAGWRDAQGVLWLPTIEGMVSLDPTRVSQNTTAPFTRVTQIEVSNQLIAPPQDKTLEIPPGRRDLRLRYTALTLLRPEQLRFRYRLVGYDRSWHEVGSNREAVYTNLPPGRYRFEVRASNSDGVWSNHGDTVALVLEPAWHERWWFPRVLLILLALAAWGGHRLRMHRLKEQNAREHRHQERYRQVFEAAANSLYLLGPKHRVRECNSAARRLHGHSPASLREVLTPESLEALTPHLRALMEDSKDLYQEVEALGKDTRPIAALLYGVPFAEEGERGALLSLIDLSEQRQMQLERRQLELQMDRARRLEAIGRLAGGLAHDFNNIMTAISLEAQHLAEDPEPDVREPAQAILESSQRAVALTRQLLTFSRGRPMQPRTFDAREALRALQPTLTRLVGDQIKLSIEIPEGAAWINAGGQQFEQVIFNLVLNASDAMPRGGALRVHLERWTREDQPWLKLTVEDEGSGIDLENQEKIFEPFFTTKEEGEGLGLSSVHGIVHQWRGEISLESHPDQGTRIQIAIPSAPTPGGSQLINAEALSPDSHPILLCEHNEVILQTAARVLRKASHKVREARTLTQARAALAQGPTPSLLLLDLSLLSEGQGDLEVLLGELTQTQFLLLGSLPGASLRQLMTHERVTLLPRPFTAQQLLRKVEQILG